MNMSSMTTLEHATLKRIAATFAIPITTVNTWAKSEKRLAHLELLSNALDAYEICDFYTNITHKTPYDFGQQLGFDNPLTLSIDGIPQRTFRSWFDTEDKHGLLKGVLIGHHWRQLQSISVRAGGPSISCFISYLKKHSISIEGITKLYLASPETLIKLIAAGVNGH
jgi:hypothetical protein